METQIEEFLRWLEARGIADERLLEYRQCAEQLLRDAQGGTVEDAHVEATRRTLLAAGARPLTLARLDEAAAALRRYQRPAPVQPPGPAGSDVAIARSPVAPGALRGKKLLVALGASACVLVVWVMGVYAYLTRPLTPDASDAAQGEEPSEEEREIHRVYLEFHGALLAGDIARLRTLLAADKLAELSGPDAEQNLELAKAFYPEKVELGRAVLQNDSAVLAAKGRISDQRVKGRIELVKQNDEWKVGKVNWTMTFGEEEQREKRNVARPADLPKLRGAWQGKETGDGTEWTLTFSADDRLSAASARGDRYAGDVLIRWDLGIDGDSLPVPPGWAPLDVEVDEASAPQAIGKVALGAFSLSAGELKFCGGPPGLATRVRSFESPSAQHRCMVLTKIAPGETAAAPTETAAPGGSSPGEATLMVDGVSARYQLETRFDTRLAKPEDAYLQFQVAKLSNEKIVVRLDATHEGSHHADGQAIHDAMFNEKPVTVGRSSDGEWSAFLQWVAEGGQVFPPKVGTRCEIRVTSTYTASENGEFTAEIPHCVVHSAGIDHTLSDVKLRIRGKLER